MQVWLLTVDYDQYDLARTDIIGVYETYEKATAAAENDLTVHTDYIPQAWALDDSGHRLYFDRKFMNDYINQQQIDHNFGYYTVQEMPVQ